MNTVWIIRLGAIFSLMAIGSPAAAQDAEPETPTILSCMADATALLQASTATRSERTVPLLKNEDDGDDIVSPAEPPYEPPPPMPAREPPKLPEELALAPMLASVCPAMLIEAGNGLQAVYCEHASLVTWECEPLADGSARISFAAQYRSPLTPR